MLSAGALSRCKIHDLFFYNSTCYELALTLLSKLWNSKFGLQFDPLEPIQSSWCRWYRKKKISVAFWFRHPRFCHYCRCRCFPMHGLHLVSTLYWNIQVSSQMMMFSINAGSSSNHSRKSEQICWWMTFWSRSNFLRRTSHGLSLHSVHHVNFFWHLYTNANKAYGTEANTNECQKVACLVFAAQANEQVFRWLFVSCPNECMSASVWLRTIFLWSIDSRQIAFACLPNICHISEWRRMLCAYTSTLCVLHSRTDVNTALQS